MIRHMVLAVVCTNVVATRKTVVPRSEFKRQETAGTVALSAGQICSDMHNHCHLCTPLDSSNLQWHVCKHCYRKNRHLVLTWQTEQSVFEATVFSWAAQTCSGMYKHWHRKNGHLVPACQFGQSEIETTVNPLSSSNLQSHVLL